MQSVYSKSGVESLVQMQFKYYKQGRKNRGRTLENLE